MKKLGVLVILALIFEGIALIFLGLSIATDAHDGLFLPLALTCVCIGSALSLAMQIIQRKRNNQNRK